MVTVRNLTEYPDAEVRALVRFGIEGSGIHDTLIVVTYTRQSRWRVVESVNGDLLAEPVLRDRVQRQTVPPGI